MIGAVRSGSGKRALVPVVAVLAGILQLVAVPMTPTPARAAQTGGVEQVTGEVTITSPLIGQAFSQPFILLTDLTAFVERDLLMPLPSPVQITGNLEGELRDGATFTIPLPVRPLGQANDLDRDGDGGVQTYAVDFQINLVGDPFLSRLEMQGWPTAITSLKVETGTNEVVGGQLLAWSPDADQRFPVGFGPDGLLFTEDDPLGPLDPGWTIVDLDREPFARIRDASVEVPIVEGDVELDDLSDLTYTEAFATLVAELRARYPFTAYKEIDWDALEAEFGPAVRAAEEAGDGEAFNVAMMGFANAIGDGHVAVDPPERFVGERFGGSVGMALGRTDDGRVVVRCVAPRGAAAKAGIAAGAEIVSWGGKPTAEALADVPQLFGESTDAGLEEQRLILLPRQPAGERVEVAFVSPEGEEGQATLRAARDGDGLGRPCGEDLADPAEMPVTVEVLPSGIGYVKVNSFAEDLTLTLHAWEWSLRKLRQLDVPALIVDIRDNGGGLSKLPVYMAGSFYDEPFTLAEQIFIDEGGEPALTAIERVEPAPMKWRGPVAVLIGPDCASACELLAAALARNPANLVVGMGATAGVEGGVFPWLLPEGIAFRAPLIGYRDDAGEIFLEGTGVQPTVRVAKTAETLLLTQGAPDAVLDAAEAALLGLTDEAPSDDAPPSATPEPTDRPIAAPDPQ